MIGHSRRGQMKIFVHPLLSAAANPMLRSICCRAAETRAMKRVVVGASLFLSLLTATAMSQEMMRGIDLASPDMISAEMTRGEVERTLAQSTPAAPADFTG